MQPRELGTKKPHTIAFSPQVPASHSWQPQSTSPHGSTYFFLPIKGPDGLGSLCSFCSWTHGGESTSALQQTSSRTRHGTQPSCLISAGNNTLPPLKLPTTSWEMQCCFMARATSLFWCTRSWSQQQGWISIGPSTGFH